MANDFSADPNLQALYTCEGYLGGADDLDDDSGKGNHLADTSGPTLEEILVKEGAKSIKAPTSAAQFTLVDGSLSADFPGKSGTTNNVFSVCYWARPTAFAGAFYNQVVCKWSSSAAKITWGTSIDEYGANPNWALYIGYNSGASFETFKVADCTVAVDQWYHVAFTYNGPTKAWHVRVWDEKATTVYDASGSGAQTMNIEDATFAVLGRAESSYGYIGILDEVAIFNDILTSDEIDEIRNQTFGGGGGGGDGGLMFGSDF